MASYHVGDVWKIRAVVTDPEAADPTEPVEPTSLAIIVTLPDGTAEVESATQLGVGTFLARVKLTQPGRWHAVVKTTGLYEATQPKRIKVLED